MVPDCFYPWFHIQYKSSFTISKIYPLKYIHIVPYLFGSLSVWFPICLVPYLFGSLSVWFLIYIKSSVFQVIWFFVKLVSYFFICLFIAYVSCSYPYQYISEKKIYWTSNTWVAWDVKPKNMTIIHSCHKKIKPGGLTRYQDINRLEAHW